MSETKPASPSGSSDFQAKDDPPAHDWKTPAAVLLLTGEQHGYFEPCGCALHQLGGMARRGDLVRMLRDERKWPVAGLDLGGDLRRNRRQDQIKFEMFMSAFKYMNYAAVNLGKEELRLGADFLLQQYPADDPEGTSSVALMSANVQIAGNPIPNWPRPYRMMTVGDVKVGVTGILGPSLKAEVAPEGTNTNLDILDPNTVLPEVIAKLEAEKPAFLVLLSHGSEAEAKTLAEKYPQFRIVLTAGGPEEPDPKPIVVGTTWILQAGHKGKQVGMLGYFPNDAEKPFKYEIAKLDDMRFKNDPYMRELMKSHQQQIEDEAIATSDELLLRHPSGNTFVGASKCGECHPKAFKHWETTGHANAFQTLLTGRPGEEAEFIPRPHDPECLSCHVTGWEAQQMLRFDSGYFNGQKSPHLLGNQCENCHGPGSKHVALEESGAGNNDEVKAGRAEVRRTLEDAKLRACVQCHDADNSPKFKPDAFNEFWEKVKHPWKD